MEVDESFSFPLIEEESKKKSLGSQMKSGIDLDELFERKESR